MARIRTIKPEFFTSLTIADLSPEQRLTFIGLWTHVDDTGRCVDDARLVKAAVWPLDDRTAADVESDLNMIHALELVIRYEVEGRRFMAVTGWSEHQKINRPSKSKFPPPDAGRVIPPPPLGSVSPHGALTEPSNGDATKPGEDSCGTHAGPSDAETTPAKPDNVADQATGTPGNAPTSGNTRNEAASPIPHGALTEPSREERNREQGTGNRERNMSATPSPSSALAPRGPDPTDREDVERICTHLADRIEANGCKRPTITQKWRTAARLMLDRDGRTEEAVHAAIDWCQNHEFWRANVMSMPKLRQQYDRLDLQARSQNRTVVPLRAGAQALTGTDARVAGWAALADQIDTQETQ